MHTKTESILDCKKKKDTKRRKKFLFFEKIEPVKTFSKWWHLGILPKIPRIDRIDS